MLGKELAVLLPSAHQVLPLGHSECDITVESQVQRVFREWRPDLVVNCAACADVDGCELDSERAFAVNATGAGHVARAAEQLAARLFHISTDYVFDGQKRTPYTETDPPNPINVYGKSKWEGEKQVLEHNGRFTPHLVIRTSWLFGIHRPSFVEKIMAEAQSQTELQAVSDQVSSPTWTFHLAQKIAELAKLPAAGILQIVNGGECSRCEMARAIVEILGRPVTIKPVAWPQLNRPAKRLAYSVQDCRRLQQLGLAPLPHWKQALEEYFLLRQALPEVLKGR